MPHIDSSIRQAVQRQQIPSGVVIFQFFEIHEEFRYFKDVVADKITPESERRLTRLMDWFESIAQAEEGRRIRWATEGSIETLPNKGGHQVGRVGHGRNLRGLVDFVWDIEPCGRVNRKYPLRRAFALRNSSVRMRLLDVALNEPVAAWDLDVGDDRSPGCHFHAKFAPVDQMARQDMADVDVPRLPGILFMPTDAIEFILGELWQEDWRRVAASSTFELNAWRNYPKHRLLKILRWYLEEVTDSKATAWLHLKLAKPDSFLFWS